MYQPYLIRTAVKVPICQTGMSLNPSFERLALLFGLCSYLFVLFYYFFFGGRGPGGGVGHANRSSLPIVFPQSCEGLPVVFRLLLIYRSIRSRPDLYPAKEATCTFKNEDPSLNTVFRAFHPIPLQDISLEPTFLVVAHCLLTHASNQSVPCHQNPP